MTLRRPSLGNVTYMIHHFLPHLAVTFKHWERNFNKFKIVLGVVIWWQHSSNTEVKLRLLLVVSLGSTAGNRRGISWLLLEYLPTVGLAAIRRHVPVCLFSRRALLEACGRALPSAALRAKQLVLSAGRGQLHKRRDQLSLAVIGSHSRQVQKESLPFISEERNSTF